MGLSLRFSRDSKRGDFRQGLLGFQRERGGGISPRASRGLRDGGLSPRFGRVSERGDFRLGLVGV